VNHKRTSQWEDNEWEVSRPVCWSSFMHVRFCSVQLSYQKVKVHASDNTVKSQLLVYSHYCIAWMQSELAFVTGFL